MSSVDLRIADSIATITLRTARARNAIDVTVVREMHGVLDQIRRSLETPTTDHTDDTEKGI